MKKILILLFLVFYGPFSYAQEEFLNDPVSFLLEPESELQNIFSLQDLTFLRLRSITPLVNINDITSIKGFLLLFDNIKTDSVDIDCYFFVEKPEKNKKDSGKITNINFVYDNNKFFVRFYPHTTDIFKFEPGRFDKRFIKHYILTDNFKVGKLR